MANKEQYLISPNGDVKTLLTFRKAVIIYDLTFHFAHSFLSKGDRTIDQMIQAARSGKQNIAEGSAAGVTSMETAIKLTNVAKASFLELLLDYEDFLRVRNFRQWEKDSEEVRFLRKKSTDQTIPDQWLSIWPKAGRPKPLPIWRSFFSIRKIICSRPSLVRWSRNFYRKAASGNRCFQPD